MAYTLACIKTNVDRLNQASPDTYETKLEFTRLYNGACTRLGEKEMNAAVNAFFERIRSNGDHARSPGNG